MAAKKRKVPLTKAGKPDKRFVTSTHARSKATKKAPTKRTVRRRSKPQVKGYSANPPADHYVKVITKKNVTGYFTGTGKMGAEFDTEFNKAKKLSRYVADIVADLVRSKYGKNVKEIRVVKKAEAGTGRKNNPVPASKLLKAKNAVNLYEDFTGHKADHYVNVRVEWPDVGLLVGKCDGILYSTVRDGVPEKYIHRFKNSARPDLVASHDGAMIALIGGKFRFTNRGIVDH